jgi:hypothetical protein
MKLPLQIPKWVYYVIGITAFAMLYAISEWGWDFLISPFLFLLGMAAASFGVVVAAPHTAAFASLEDDDQKMRLSFSSVAAIAHGLSFILLGILLVVGAFIRLLGIWAPVWAYLTQHPGWLLGLAGTGLLLVSVRGVFGQQEPKRKGQLIPPSLPRRIFSGLGIFLALGLVLLGLLELLWRPGFNAIIQALLDFLPQVPDYDVFPTPVGG